MKERILWIASVWAKIPNWKGSRKIVWQKKKKIVGLGKDTTGYW